MTKLSLYLVTILLGSRFPGPALPPAAPPPALVVSASITADEQKLVDLANEERRSRGLSELKVNPMLIQVAREHSREMCEMDYFDHVSPTPDLHTPKDRYLKALGHTPSWAIISENIFYASIVSPELGHRLLMKSEPHRENILNSRFEEIGIGVYESPDGKFWVTQMFLTQID